MQRTHFTAGYTLYNYVCYKKKRYPIMVKCLNIGKPTYRSIYNSRSGKVLGNEHMIGPWMSLNSIGNKFCSEIVLYVLSNTEGNCNNDCGGDGVPDGEFLTITAHSRKHSNIVYNVRTSWSCY